MVGLVYAHLHLRVGWLLGRYHLRNALRLQSDPTQLEYNHH